MYDLFFSCDMMLSMFPKHKMQGRPFVAARKTGNHHAMA